MDIEEFIISLVEQLAHPAVHPVLITGAIIGFIAGLIICGFAFHFYCLRQTVRQAYLARTPKEIIKESCLAEKKIRRECILTLLILFIIGYFISR